MTGGFQGTKGTQKREKQHGMRRGKGGKKGKGRDMNKRKEEKDLSFSLSVPAQLEEGPPGLPSSWADKRSPSLPSPWVFSLSPSAEQADSSHPRTSPCS